MKLVGLFFLIASTTFAMRVNHDVNLGWKQGDVTKGDIITAKWEFTDETLKIKRQEVYLFTNNSCDGEPLLSSKLDSYERKLNYTKLATAPSYTYRVVVFMSSAEVFSTPCSPAINVDQQAPQVPTSLTLIGEMISEDYSFTARWNLSTSSDVKNQLFTMYQSRDCSGMPIFIDTLDSSTKKVSLNSKFALNSYAETEDYSYKIGLSDYAGNQSVSSCSILFKY